MDKQKILITGTCGFIFSNFVRKLIYLSNKDPEKYPYTVVSIDKVNTNMANSIYWNKSHTFHIADITDSHIIDTIFQFEKPDIVIHGAAESAVDDSLSNPNVFITSNVLGTQVIINACLKYDVQKMMYISCFDEQTKALTKNGLKSFSELKIGDLVLSINPKTKKIEEKEIENIIVQDYNGDMCNFKSSRVDLCTTPNHRFLYENTKNELNWTTAEQMNALIDKKYLPIGKISNTNHNSIINIPDLGDVDSNSLFYLCGAFLGDGFTSYQEKNILNKSKFTKEDFLKKCRDKSGKFISKINTINPTDKSICKSYRIFFDVPENDKCRKKLEEALTKLDIKYHAEKNKSGEHIYFTSKKWMNFFNTFGSYSYNKFIPDWMFNFSLENLTNLWLGLHDSDGHGFNLKNKTPKICTVSKKMAEQIAYIGEMIGYHTNINIQKYYKNYLNGRLINKNHDCFVISFSNKRSPIFPQYYKTNYNGKIWCLKVKDNKNFLIERNGKIAFSGNTDEVYGQLENESDPSWTESSPLNPRNPYAASKAAGELLVKAAHESHGLIYNITRTSNNYGPRQTPNKLIPKVIKCIINNEKIPVFGEGKQIRDWTHVFDNCSAIINILKNGNSNEIYNISANQEFSNIEVIQNICNVIGSGYNLIEHIEDPRKGHDFRYSIDSSKTKSLGWKPQYRFKDGIVDTIKWFYDNKWYLR